MAFFGGAEGARLEPASSLSERVSARALRNCALHGLGLANRNVRNPGHLQRKLRTKAACHRARRRHRRQLFYRRRLAGARPRRLCWPRRRRRCWRWRQLSAAACNLGCGNTSGGHPSALPDRLYQTLFATQNCTVAQVGKFSRREAPRQQPSFTKGFFARLFSSRPAQAALPQKVLNGRSGRHASRSQLLCRVCRVEKSEKSDPKPAN